MSRLLLGRASGRFVRRGLLGVRAEEGFSLVEAVVAIGTIFVSLTALAYTGTVGFKYIADAREQQAANQIADKVMEDVRGLPYATVTQGLSVNLATELAASPDPFISDCGGVLHLKTCDVQTTIVDDSPAAVYPLVPHSGVVGRADGYPIDYTWRTYVTNPDPAQEPYTVTVVVTWTVRGIQKVVQTQSLFAAPGGSATCDEATHSFAGPCQPFFFGQASATQGSIDIAPSDGVLIPIQASTFVSGSLALTGAETALQQEQIANVQGTLLQTGVSLTDASGTQQGAASITTAADSDPSGDAPEYSRNPVTGAYSGAPFQYTTLGSNQVTFGNAAGDTGESVSTGAATATNVCPPSIIGTAEADNPPQACGGTWVRQAGTLEAYGILDALPIPLGRTSFARVSGLSTGGETTTFADRELGPDEGSLQLAVERSIGEVEIGGLPEGASEASGAWEGYLITLRDYSDSANATAGKVTSPAPPPTTTVSAGATISVWNGSGYTSVAADDPGAVLPTPAPALGDISGHSVVAQMTPLSGVVAGATVQSNSDSAADPNDPNVLMVTNSQASVQPPLTGSFRYTITVDGVTVVDLTISVDLGAIVTDASYAPAPVIPSPSP